MRTFHDCLLVHRRVAYVHSSPTATGRQAKRAPISPVRGGTRATEPTTSDLDPFPAVRVQSGCSDLGQSRVQIRQLYAPQRPRTRLFAGLSFLKKPHGLGVMIGAIHGSPVIVRVLRTARDIWTYLDQGAPADRSSPARDAGTAATLTLNTATALTY